MPHFPHNAQINPLAKFIVTRFKRPSIGFAILLGSLAGIGGCEEAAPIIIPKAVVVEQVSTATVPLYGNYIGITKASLDVEVRARVNGFVEDKSFVEGSGVKEGSVLYRIDDRPYVAVVNRLKAIWSLSSQY